MLSVKQALKDLKEDIINNTKQPFCAEAVMKYELSGRALCSDRLYVIICLMMVINSGGDIVR